MSIWTPSSLEMKHGFSHCTLESKEHSLHWCCSHSHRTKKFKTSISVKKIMVSVFWDTKGILLFDFMPPGSAINAPAYCDTLTGFDEPFKTKGVECCHAVCACSTTTRGPILGTSPLCFWKNSSGIYWTICHTGRTSHPVISTVTRCKKKS